MSSCRWFLKKAEYILDIRDMVLSKMQPKYVETVFCGYTIRVRVADGHLSATDLANAADKRWAHYYENDTTEAFLEALAKKMGKEIKDLIDSKRGGHKSSLGKGTWIHPQVAIHFATWLSGDFAADVTEWVIRYLKGDITLAAEIIERHGPIENDEEKKQVSDIEIKLHSMKEEYEEKLREKDGIIKEKQDKIDDLMKKLDEQHAELMAKMDMKDAKIDEQMALLKDVKKENVEQTALLNTMREENTRQTVMIGDLQNTLEEVEDKLDVATDDRVVTTQNPEMHGMFLLLELNNPDHPWSYYAIRRQRKTALVRLEEMRLAHPNLEVCLNIGYQPNTINLFNVVKEKLRNTRHVIEGHYNNFNIAADAAESGYDHAELLRDIIAIDEDKKRVEQK
jgi:hypothetical protein